MKNSHILQFVVILLATSSLPDSVIADTIRPGAFSLAERKLLPIQQAPETQARMETELKKFKARYDKKPSEQNTIWYGRKLDDLSRFLEAIEVYSKGLERYPDSYRLYRRRGLRYINTRQFNKAIADSEKAYQLMPKNRLEPEYPDPERKMPAEGNTQFFIVYHYGLAHYLKEDYAQAEHFFRESIVYSDDEVASKNWLYLSLMRQNKISEAKDLLESINPGLRMEFSESPYYKMILLYRGFVEPEDLLPPEERENEVIGGVGLWDNPRIMLTTYGYGVANWYFFNGQPEKAKKTYKRILKMGYWSAGGYIATEADIYNLYKLIR